MAAGDRLSIAMVAPQRYQCGVTDYTRHLLEPLRHLAEVRYVTDAPGFTAAMNAVDLVHVQHQYFLFGGVAPWKCRFGAFARRVRAPAVMTVHEFVSPAGRGAFRAAVSLSNRLHFRHPAVRRLIVHTQEDRDRMAAAGIPRERVSVVRHGVPPARVLPDPDTARAALGLEGRFVVTVFGFLSRRKGHLLALEALAALPEEVVLLFAGGRHPDDATGYVADVGAAIARLGLQKRARVTGYLTAGEADRVMAASHVVAAPFLASSGSGSLAYAFSCGMPILASDIAPHREIVADTPGSLGLFAAGDAGALAEAVERLAAAPGPLRAMQAGSRAYAERHSYAKMAEETVEVYQLVMKGRASCA